ncbi:CD109 antigen-like [Babylonia areolata]|uniref:CD109 antigen-like n=1 Tax=Babylonia areolata TaxID=304850 RepID=UPI003FD125B3
MKLFLMAALVAAVAANDSYVVVAPSKLRPGMEYSVSVNVLRASGDVSVTASIISTNHRHSYATNTATLQQGAPKIIDLQLPTDLPTGRYELHVAGTGGLTFTNKTHVTFSAKAKSVLVQTDKAMYKPGQTVNFRVLAVYPDLSLYKGNLDIEIYDANSNKIKQWIGVNAGQGVITQALPLSTQPVLGDWRIKVTADKTVEQKKITIAEYVLPKFEVTVELPSYVLESAASVPVTVKAKYTYGKPVSGSVVVQSELTHSNYHSGPRTVQRNGQLDEQGSVVIDFPMTELHHLSTSLSTRGLKFSANVTDTLTGTTRGGSSTVQVYTHNVKLEFPASNPKTFKPGLDYVAYLKVSQPDGLPLVSAAGQSVTIGATVTAELPTPGTTPYPYYYPRITTFHLPDLSLSIPQNGLVPIQLTVPGNATSISLHATMQSGKASSVHSTILKSFSPSSNYMQLFLRTSAQLQAGGQASFEMKATEGVDTLVYQVMSRGSIVAAGSVSAGGASSATFSLPLQSNMAPNARIVVYYVRADGEIVTDSISFDVDGAFQNKVSVSVNTTEAEPADRVQVTVKAEPQSTAYLLAVDQSVLLLKSGNDITSSQVMEELKSYDTIRTPGTDISRYRYRAGFDFYITFPVYYGGSDANDVFQNAGVVVMTDAMVYNYVRPVPTMEQIMECYRHNITGCPHVHWHTMGFLMGHMEMEVEDPYSTLPPRPSHAPLEEVEHVRNVFPETWLWTSVTAGGEGRATVNTTVPDTITSWVTSAFAVSPTAGLGVAPTTSKLRVFRPFFVTLNLPYSVIRGEQLVLQAIVFNYMQHEQNVRVTLAQSQDFVNIVHDANGNEDYRNEDRAVNVLVPAGEGKSVYFPIVPSSLGNVELVVSAQSTQAADAVRRQLLVEAEGVPKEFGVSVLVDLSHKSSFHQTVHLALPPNLVSDSSRSRVTAIGDLMGPTISGLDSLLRMPTGCGEQTMLSMAPDVFVTAYLSATKQLTGEVSEKAIGFMESGYQRELTYQHKDGSFSAFGDRDDSGSMWLTAFVAKTFHQAKPYVFIDDQVIVRALSWMVARQRPDGSFPEPGRVIHKNMQGGAGNGTGLTAFVLISLLENSDIQGSLSQHVQEAKVKAVTFLKGQLPTVTDDYLLAVVTYALTLASDPTAPAALQRLAGHAVTRSGFRYWHKEPVTTTSSSTHHAWRTPQAGASDVEMTSYALLTYAATNDITGGLDVLKWVASQRNPRGGFSSTQDTVLALQALSEFARHVYSSNFNVQINVKAGAFSRDYSITPSNALLLQSDDLSYTPNSLTVTGTGSGIALVEVGVFFNVEAEVEEPTFDVTVTLEKDSLNTLQLQTCARWLGEGSSGMAVMEVGIPSGFEVDVDNMQSPRVLKRTEVEDRKMVLYFDAVGSSQVCTVLVANRVSMVTKSKPVAVRVYDYYEPDNQATTFYESAVLKSSSVCDVCAECGCPLAIEEPFGQPMVWHARYVSCYYNYYNHRSW